uniref:Uncharacterized protein n=1 Tax=Opuntia streptacantha TaxID=393608 RepID=A0A7C9ERD6_OPUST
MRVEEFVNLVVGVDPEKEWPLWPSTGFLERWRPLFICRSQYFWSGMASLEHRHFFPSVLRQRPGSGSVLFENPRWKGPHSNEWGLKSPPGKLKNPADSRALLMGISKVVGIGSLATIYL